MHYNMSSGNLRVAKVAKSGMDLQCFWQIIFGALSVLCKVDKKSQFQTIPFDRDQIVGRLIWKEKSI